MYYAVSLLFLCACEAFHIRFISFDGQDEGGWDQSESVLYKDVTILL